MKAVYTIRTMEKEDIPQVAEIEAQLFSTPWTQQGFLDSLKQKDTLYLVAEAGGEIAGYCGLLQSFDEADITNVAVAPDWQGKGIAFSMLKALMEEGKKRGIARYTLEVRVSNAVAIHIYEKLGFHSVGIRKRFYEKPTEDAMIMWTE